MTLNDRYFPHNEHGGDWMQLSIRFGMKAYGYKLHIIPFECPSTSEKVKKNYVNENYK
jgi:hypothetical protein